MEEVCERKCVCLLLFLVTEFVWFSAKSSKLVGFLLLLVTAQYEFFSRSLSLSLSCHFSLRFELPFESPLSSRRQFSFICPFLAFDIGYALSPLKWKIYRSLLRLPLPSVPFCESTLCPDIKFSILRRILNFVFTLILPYHNQSLHSGCQFSLVSSNIYR